MRTHSNDFKQAIIKNGRELDSKVTYTLNGETKELGGEKLNSVTPVLNTNILCSSMKELDLETLEDIAIGTEIHYEFGVKVGSSYEYLDFGNYIVYSSEKNEDTRSYSIVCYDKMLNSMKDYKPVSVTYPCSLLQYTQALCSKIGLTLSTTNFKNKDRIITSDPYQNIGYTYRDVLDEIAEATGSIITLDLNDNVVFKYINNTVVDSIDGEMIKDVNVKFGKTYGPINTVVLSRSGGSDNLSVSIPSNLADDQKVAIKISDNQLMNGNDRSDYINELLNAVYGLSYSINDYSSTGICYLEAGDRYNVVIDDTTYSCVMLYDEVNITQGLVENIHCDEPEEAETDYTKTDTTDQRINQTYLIVDKQNQSISSVVTQQTSQGSKISKLEQDVEEIKSEISDIAEITVSADGYGSISVEGINAGEPIKIKVHPYEKDVTALFPSNTTYSHSASKSGFGKSGFAKSLSEQNTDTLGSFPSNETFPYSREIVFSENKKYTIPKNLYIYNGVYDEFNFDYEAHSFTITHRIGLDSGGNKYILENETVEDLPYETIELQEGDYNIWVCSNAYIYGQFMAKNIYTDQFATRVQVSSMIEQKADSITTQVAGTYATKDSLSTSVSRLEQTDTEINATVSNKVGNNEVISRINQSAEQITINANKLNLQGYITASDLSGSGTTTINGANITTGTLSADRINGGTISGSALNLGSGNFTVDTSGNLSSKKASITGGSININNYFSVNSSGGTQMSTSGGGFLTTRTTTHPYMSAINVSNRNGGIFINNGEGQGDVGTNQGHINGENGVLYLNKNVTDSSGRIIFSSNGVNIDNGGLKVHNNWAEIGELSIGSYLINRGKGGQISLQDGNVVLNPASGKFAYVGGTGYAQKILVGSGGTSTLSVKENVVEKDTSDVIDILRKIKLYDYNYIKDVEEGRTTWGYIIDYLEKIKGFDKYVEIIDNEDEYNSKHLEIMSLIKFLLATNVEQQKMIDNLTKEIDDLKEKRAE